MLTLATSTSYNSLTAFLIWYLLAFNETWKTKVLPSSTFFIAVSEVIGCSMILYESNLTECGTALEAYFGALANFKVFGNLKVADVLTFKAFLPLVPLTTAFLAAVALAI